MTKRNRGWLVGLVAALVIGHTAAGEAVDFTWNQSGGFALGTGSLLAGPRGPGFPGPGVAGHGGLEFFQDPNDPPAPAGTYRSISWGCLADGNNSPGVTNCANGGVVGEVVSNQDPTNDPGRSSLVFFPFDNITSPTPSPVGVFTFSADGTLRDDGLWVVVQRLDHLNRVIDNEGNYLGGITTQTSLTINSVPPFTDNNAVPIVFIETLNEVVAADCVGENPLGSACDDVFTFDTSDFNDQVFTSNGIQYLLEFNLSPFPDCSDIVSTEGRSSSSSAATVPTTGSPSTSRTVWRMRRRASTTLSW